MAALASDHELPKPIEPVVSSTMTSSVPLTLRFTVALAETVIPSRFMICIKVVGTSADALTVIWSPAAFTEIVGAELLAPIRPSEKLAAKYFWICAS